MFKKLLLFSCFVLCFSHARAAFIPVPLTGYNFDGVGNGAGAITGSTTASFDGQGYYLFDSTFVHPTYGIPNVPAMPTSLSVTSLLDANVQWQLAPYTGNNILRITNVATDSMVLQTPLTGAGELYVLYTNIVNGTAGNATITANFTDGTTQVFSSNAMTNWFGGSPNLVKIIGGRLNNNAGGGYQNNNSSTGGPLLYQFKLTLLPANYTKTIRSVTFSNNVTNNILNVFAITANTVCSGAVTAGSVASSSGISACSGVNFNLSLTGATSGVGISYQWQSSTTGTAPWTNMGTASTQTTSQTATTTYRAYIACITGSADTTAPFTLNMKALNQCYCIPTNTSASQTYYISAFSTTGGTTNITNNSTGAGITSQGYSDYSGTLSASAMQGNSINFSAAFNSTHGARIWVDWNQNGTFDASEMMYSTSSYVSTIAGSFTIPNSALPGATRMRIRNHFLNTGAGIDPCANITTYSEAEDYTFNVIALPSCTGTPAPGVASANAFAVCATESFILSSTGGPATGLTNQWQRSLDGGFTWTDIVGATANPYTVSGQTVSTQYRDKQACTITSSPDVLSSVVTVGSRACYCNPTFTSGCGSWRLTNVTVGTINNSPTVCTNSNYLNLSTTVTAAVPFPMSITTNQYMAAGVYIDLNNDGDFNDVDENLYTEPYSGAATSTVTPTIIIPGYAAAGAYRLRVVGTWATSPAAGQACNTFQYGNFHDYTLNVLVATPCVTPTAQPTALNLTASATVANLSFTAATPAPDRYLIVRTQGAPLSTIPVNGTTYTIGATLGNGTVVGNAAATTLTDGGLLPGTSYTYSIFSLNSLCAGGPLYLTTSPLIDSITTPAQGIYSWNGSVSKDWTIAANWTPTRTLLDPSDILQFNNGHLTDTANNIPKQTISRLVFANNTIAYLQAAGNNTLTMGDTTAATADLSIAAGSALISNGNAFALTLAFGGTGATATIAGKLESASNAVNNVFNLANAITTITGIGTLTEGGTFNGAAVSGTTATNFLINGLFEYKYTTNAVGLPLGSWNTGSTLLINGYTTATGGPNGNQNQTFYNFTYNCINQTSTSNWSGTGALTVLNNFTVNSTGTGTWQYASTQGYTANINNYIQTGGVIDIASGNTTTGQTFNITGNFTKTGGTFKASNTTGQPTLNFNGSASQNVSLDASPTGRMWYRISNNAGINLTGNGGLTTFNINDNGGMRISTTATSPVTTALIIAYGANGTTLVYDTTGSYTMTANVYPTVAGPQNLTINTGSSANVITMPFSRTVPGTLTMTSGDIALNANNLTLGTAPATPGTLTYTAGNIRVTSGTMIRWFNTSGLPTGIANNGLFPVSYGALTRAVNVYFSASNALSTGGTLAVGHTNTPGITTGLSVADGAYTINNRTNSFWNFTTGNGIAATGTIGLRLNGTGLFTSSTPVNLRVMQATTVVGTHVPGAAPAYAQRSGLTIANLSAPYYIGANVLDMTGAYVAINNGPWGVGTTWDIGSAPGVTNDAYINSGVTVTANAATNTAKSLNILPGGTLTATLPGGIVTIDSALLNNGTLNVTGGTVVVNGNSGTSGITNTVGSTVNIGSGTLTVGPINGGNKPFNNFGLLAVTGGTMNVNGNLQLNNGSTFNQSGGNVNVDGNAGNVLANSVAGGTPIVNILTPNLTLTGGNFTVVDPHPAASTNTFVYNNGTSVNASGTHTFISGNGLSTDTGFNASFGLSVNTNVGSGKLALMNVLVNSGAAANSWLVLGAGSSGVLGNLTINTGKEFRQGGTGNILYLGGNLTNNGTYSALGVLYFGNYLNGTITSASAAQSVTGTGLFRNSLVNPTAKFYKIQANNNYNVTFNIGDVPFSNNVTVTPSTAPAPVGPSRIVMAGTSILSEIAGASFSNAGAATGWVVGRYQKAAGVGGMANNYPIGDTSSYAPVSINGTVSTPGAVWASTTAGDHPNIGSASINPLLSLNRFYTVDTTNGITFTAGSISATFNYPATDLDNNVTPANLIIGEYKGSTWTYPTVSLPTATSIKATGLTGNVSGQFAIGEGCLPITLATVPGNKSGCLGSSITFNVGSTPNTGIIYQWMKGGTNIPGANDSTFTIPVLVAGDAGNYTVRVSSGCTSVAPIITLPATLTINTPATITTQPAATPSFCEGVSGSLTVVATGTNITYQWKKGGVAITGATSATYSIPSISTADTGSYTVDVIGSAPCGTITSNISTLSVKPLPLAITAGSTTSFCIGSTVVLSASATPATLTYQWKNNGVNIPGATSNSYTAAASGSYTVFITNTNPLNGCSGTSNAIIVNANGAPQAVISPAGTAAYCQGSSITLHGNSAAGLTYQWLLNGNPVPVGLDSTYSAATPGSYVLKVAIGSGCSTTSTPTVVTQNPLPVITTVPTGPQGICQNDTLTITAVYNNATVAWRLNGNLITPAAIGNVYKATTSGNYSVTATSTTTGCVNTSAPVTLTVNALPVISIASLNATSFCAGGSDTLRATPATGLTYVWNRGGSPISPTATGVNYVATATGSYTVTATNANNCKATSNTIAVTANPQPSVVVSPSAGLAICQGQTTSLCVPNVTGVTYQWKNGGVNIAGATTACYAATTAGTYSVTASTTATGCTATSVISAVTVSPLPVAAITAPATTANCEGDTICLNANTGSNLTYQWKLNSNSIVGATAATYCATVAGAYSVVVTNGNNCSSTSNVVTMTFKPRPTSSITYTTPVTFCEGGAVVLTGVSNTGTTYQWQNNGAAIVGANSNSYIASSTGNYSVIITNSGGCSTVSPTIVVVANPLPQPLITRAGNILSTGSYASYQWYLNSQAIAGATNQSVLANQNGGYTVRVIDANGCTNYSGVTFVNNVGIGNNPTIAASSVKVFPNPVRNVINIEAQAMVNVLLRDLTGRIIKQSDNAKQLDLTGLADGYYMLMITDKNGTLIKAEKVMKVAE